MTILQAEGLSLSSSVFDVTDASSVRSTLEVIETKGPVDILIKNAEMQIRSPLHEYVDADWLAIIKSNSDSVYYVGKAVERNYPQENGGNNQYLFCVK